MHTLTHVQFSARSRCTLTVRPPKNNTDSCIQTRRLTRPPITHFNLCILAATFQTEQTGCRSKVANRQQDISNIQNQEMRQGAHVTGRAHRLLAHLALVHVAGGLVEIGEGREVGDLGQHGACVELLVRKVQAV